MHAPEAAAAACEDWLLASDKFASCKNLVTLSHFTGLTFKLYAKQSPGKVLTGWPFSPQERIWTSLNQMQSTAAGDVCWVFIWRLGLTDGSSSFMETYEPISWALGNRSIFHHSNPPEALWDFAPLLKRGLWMFSRDLNPHAEVDYNETTRGKKVDYSHTACNVLAAWHKTFAPLPKPPAWRNWPSAHCWLQETGLHRLPGAPFYVTESLWWTREAEDCSSCQWHPYLTCP